MRAWTLVFWLLAVGAISVSAGETVQASAVLTVAEGKRLIARAIARMPVVQAALRDGTVVVTRGSTNSYIAEELLGEPVPHGAFVTGAVTPAGRAPARPPERLAEIILVRGRREDLTLEEAMRRLRPGDVVLKGANLLDVPRGRAAVLIGAPDGGTVGRILPYVVARRAHLLIPVGLEKQGSGCVTETAARMREPVDSLNATPSMIELPGRIVTELDAIEILSGARAFQAAAGGVAGAEGAVWLVVRGTRAQVAGALEWIEGVRGEPPFWGPRPEPAP